MNAILPYKRRHFNNRFSTSLSIETDGVNEYLDYGGSVVNASEGSIDLWVKILSFTSGTAGCIFSDSGGYIQLTQVVSLAGQYQFGVYAAFPRRSGTIFLNLNTWYHIVCTWKNGVEPKIYKNKIVAIGATALPANISDVTLPFRMGGQGVATTYTNIRLNLHNVWNKELSQAEVDELYDTNAGKPMNPTLHSAAANLTHAYRSGNGDTYPTITDHIGSKNGTMTNMETGDFVSDTP